MIKTFKTALPGVLLIGSAMYPDSRGYFREAYHRDDYVAAGISEPFVQVNHSFSHKNVLRGLHYQLARPQAKLCRVIAGEVLDVVVDIRAESPTFGQHFIQKLNSLEVDAIYIPAGYAHGFLALSDVHFEYSCSDIYSGLADQHGIRWDDPDLAIPWPITDPILSDKDRTLPLFRELSIERLP